MYFELSTLSKNIDTDTDDTETRFIQQKRPHGMPSTNDTLYEVLIEIYLIEI